MQIKVSIVALYTFNPAVFDLMQLPENVSRETVIDTILDRCSEFPLLNVNYEYVRHTIGTWSARNLKIWEAMQKSVEVEYNPIENYDRYETIKREVQGSSNSEAKSGKTAFDSNTFKDTDHSSGEGSSEGSETVDSHMHGNIGVTTAAQMLEGYRAISNFSVVEFIAQSFADNFCVQVY